MPSLDDLLAHTLLRTAARESGTKGHEVDSFDVPKPTPQSLEGIDDTDDQISVIRRNKLWHWHHGPTPNMFHHLTAKVRGMGMNYNHAMPVADAVVFDHVRVQRIGRIDWLNLPLTDLYVLRKEFLRSGTVHGNGSWWPIRLPLDASGFIVFGYELGPDEAILPITDRALLESSTFMPSPKAPAFFRMIAGERDEALVVVDRIRYVVVLELSCGREDDSYVPGSGIGFVRLHPLVWFCGSETVDNVEVQTTVQRPAKTMSHGDDTMETTIGLLITSDSNQTTMPGWPLGQGKVVPYWSNFFTLIEDDPVRAFGSREPESYDHPLQKIGELSTVDPRDITTRVIERAIQRRQPGFLPDEAIYDSITKLPRQGQIDNVHMAPRMRLEFDQDGEHIVLDKIAMAPFCIHDCLHAHWRWGVVHDDKELRGFRGQMPHQIAGGPSVPNNQAVFVSFPNTHTLRIRAVAGPGATQRTKPNEAEQDRPKAGELQVFNYPGFGYVSDTFPGEAIKIDAIKTLVAFNALEVGEPYRSMPDDGDGWARLYWRLRYGGRGKKIVERLTTDWDKVLRPE